MQIRNRFTLFLAMPLVAFFWFFGWSLYWIGSMKQTAAPVERKRQEYFTLDVLSPEQQYAK